MRLGACGGDGGFGSGAKTVQTMALNRGQVKANPTTEEPPGLPRLKRPVDARAQIDLPAQIKLP